MTNKEILEALEKRGEIENNHSYNAEQVALSLCEWDKSEAFPIDELQRYVRFNEWTFEDFSFENENVIKDVLPAFVLDIFFMVKNFRSNRRNELTSDEKTYAQIKGLPYNTQDEKALCVYEFGLGWGEESRIKQ